MDIAEEMTAVAAVRLLASSAQDEEGIGLQCSREALVSSLERDLQGPRVRATLQGLYDMLVDGEQSHRAAVGEVLDTVSWEAFGLVVGCLERFATSPSPNSSGSVTGTFDKSSDEAETLTTSRDADDCAALSEGLALAMAEIFSPKELHLMTLEHLHAYTKARTLRVVLTILRRSTQRMATARRSKFLEASLRPALEATKRVGLVAAAGDAQAEPGLPQKSSGSDADEDPDDDGTGGDEEPPPPPPLPLPTADEDMLSRAAYDAAASAAETAADFVGPLMEQASAERALLAVSGLPTAGRGEGRPAAAAVATSAGGSGRAVGSGEKEGVSASDLSLAAYIGFALSALELAGETSVCCTAAAAAAAAAATGSEDNPPAGESLARAQERLVGIVVDSPLDLRFVLLHGCRVSYASGVKRRRRRSEGGGEEGESQLPATRLGGAVGLGEAAINGALPWTLRGVSTLAYLVACEPRLRDKWLPLVWSRRTERRLFLPHAEVLMRDRSKRVASKGLELACFVAERLGGFPNRTGAFAFDWEPGDEEIDGAGDDGGGGGAWNGGGREERGAVSSTTSEGTSPSSRRRPFDPHRLDLAGFLQVLVDVMVSCPLPGLRTRGHAALVALLGAADEASRFRVLRRLVELCPWPNARGLLLDAFRREIDRALRQCGIVEEERQQQQQQQQQQAAPAAPSLSSSSPFASALAGDVVCGQLRRACRRGPLASLMADMDSRTGGLALARYAHKLDAVGGARGGSGRAEAGAAWGRLELREPKKLLQNRLLVQGLLDELRGAVITADNAGPEHFRLFILEDAAQQCLQELELAVVQ